MPSISISIIIKIKSNHPYRSRPSRAFLFAIAICKSFSLVRHEHEPAPRINNPLLCNQWKVTEHREPNTPSNNVIVAAEADASADQKKTIR